jgi:predicted nucleotidyltransferase
MTSIIGIGITMLGITIEKLFSTPGQIRVMRVLLRAGKPLTGRQVQKLAGLANLSAMRALKHLTVLGVVSCRQAGRSHQYELKMEHWAVDELVSPIFKGEEKGLDLICGLLTKKLDGQCQMAYLYGSAVDSSRDTVGDIDLFISVKTEKEREVLESSLIPEISEKISERFGLFLEPNIVTSKELSRNPALKMAEEIAQDGLKLCGGDISEVISR